MRLNKILMLTAAFLLGSSVAMAAGPQTLKVSFNAKETNPIVKAFRDVFMPYVEEHTGGKYKFELYTGGVLGAAKQRIQAMRNGMIQMSVESTANLSQFAPDLSLLDLPYIVKSREAVNKLFQSDTGKALLAPLAKNVNLQPLTAMMSTFRVLGLNRPGTTLEELKGAKIRTSNSREHITSINALGLTATPMPHSEAFTGLQQKVIDGIELEVPTYQEDHFYEVANNIIKTNCIPVMWVLDINAALFRKMPPEDQQVFQNAADLYTEEVSRQFDDFEEKALKEMAAIPGVTVTVLSEEEIDAWRKAGAAAYNELSDSQKKTVEAIRAAE